MEENNEKMKLTAKKSDNFSEWYTQVLISSEFIDYSAVSGMIVFRADSYFVWDQLRNSVDKMFYAAGIKNAYFPLFIPERFLALEKEHVKGFSPEVAWVTHAGDSELSERLAVRPTSETIMYDSYAKWIRSWRDLPLRLNQWNNVVRWEFKHPTPFLRSREFLWNEGHTAFATKEEADSERDVIIGIYTSALKDYLALPGIPGQKTEKEKFAGAEASYSIELVMPDGWVIQGPDFHSDGQKFSKVFGIKFLDKDNISKYVYQNTFAISTRVLGTMVATHGDDKGLILPPKLAMIQVVVVPIYKGNNKDAILEYSKKIAGLISDVRVYLDDTDAYSPGWKFNEWELKGVPVRLEIGDREMNSDAVVIFRRDTLQKSAVKSADLNAEIKKTLDSIHQNLYQRAESAMKASIHPADTYEALKNVIKTGGLSQSPWCGSMECEDKIKEETGAKASNMPFDAQSGIKNKKCVYCGKEAKHIVNFAKSY
ncbi:proline--tRNA ligase [Candidatus Marsarchaeota archaeon]|jgi:prolyl-tRNA synthetase|nr:proline--tRNA ligase [Candidatus Marsarchaeota archaeon]MCL5092758.1 proline--tRNA ligase [Candidatus Marsarchaeota archaeon]